MASASVNTKNVRAMLLCIFFIFTSTIFEISQNPPTLCPASGPIYAFSLSKYRASIVISCMMLIRKGIFKTRDQGKWRPGKISRVRNQGIFP
jgi:hypothetical protein